MEGFIFFFLFMVSWILFTDTFFLRHALFLLEFCSLFLLKGFLLVYLFERWQHFNFASTRTFSRVSWVLLHICCSQIVQAMTDPILRAAKGFSPRASVLLHLRTFGASYLFLFYSFCLFLQRLFNFLPLFPLLPASTKWMKHHGSLGIWVSSFLWSHSANAYPFWENNLLLSCTFALDSIDPSAAF